MTSVKSGRAWSLRGEAMLASIPEVHPHDLPLWLAACSGPPRPVFEKAVDIILAERERRAAAEESASVPRRRRTDR